MWRTTQLGGGVDVGAWVWVECWRVCWRRQGWGGVGKEAAAASGDGGGADGRVPMCSSAADERGAVE